MVKILAIGDFHGKFPRKLKKEAKDVDFVLCTGDFGGSDRLLKIVFKYFYDDWTEKVGKKKTKELIMEDYSSGKKMINELGKLGKPVYTVDGNWDFERGKSKDRYGGLKLKNYSELMKKKKNIKFLNKRSIKVQGKKICAFGGIVTASIYLTKESGFDKNKRDKERKRHEKEKKRLFKLKDKNIDFFLAHYPPYGYFDVVKFKGHNPMNGKHVGFKPYTEFIKKYQPKVFICGHMHEYQGVKKIGKTKVVATGAACDGKAAVINISDKGKINVKFVR